MGREDDVSAQGKRVNGDMKALRKECERCVKKRLPQGCRAPGQPGAKFDERRRHFAKRECWSFITLSFHVRIPASGSVTGVAAGYASKAYLWEHVQLEALPALRVSAATDAAVHTSGDVGDRLCLITCIYRHTEAPAYLRYPDVYASMSMHIGMI